jgi:CRP/FNR family transcriptional regulator
MRPDTNTLEQVTLFRHLDPAQLQAIVDRLSVRHVPKNEVLCRQGERGDTLMIVAAGDVSIHMTGEAGNDLILANLSPGGAFGELALIDDGPRSATAVATEDTTIYTLSRSAFRSILAERPEIWEALTVSLAAMVRATNDKIADLIFMGPHEKIAKALLELSDRHGVDSPAGRRLHGHGDVAEIAASTGLHPNLVERLLANYQYEDILRRDGFDLVIHRPEVLESWLRLSKPS